MGEANLKKINLAAVKEIHFSVRERLTLAIYLVANVKPATRDERKRFRRVFRELDMDVLVALMENPQGVPTEIATDHAASVYSLTGDTLDYVLDKLNAPTQGIASLILGELEDRIAAVKDDSYVVPTHMLEGYKTTEATG